MRGLGLGVQLLELLQVAEAPRPHVDPTARHALQLQLHPGDEPGQPEPTHGRSEERIPGSEGSHRSIRPAKAEGEDVPAERPGPVVVLAVDVVGHRPAEGDVLGAGQDRRQPPVRQDQLGHLSQGGARLRAKHARLPVEGEEPAQATSQQHRPRTR